MQVVGVPYHRRVNLFCASGSDGDARKDTGIILVWAERPYVQFRASRVLALVCSRGYKRAREGTNSQVFVLLSEAVGA